MNDKAEMSSESLKDKDISKDIEESLKEIKERTSEFVKEHPIVSIAIAAGVGYLIAKLISRGRS